MELLDHTVILGFIFEEPQYCVCSLMAAPFYIPTLSARGFQLLLILVNICSISRLLVCVGRFIGTVYPNGQEVVSYWVLVEDTLEFKQISVMCLDLLWADTDLKTQGLGRRNGERLVADFVLTLHLPGVSQAPAIPQACGGWALAKDTNKYSIVPAAQGTPLPTVPEQRTDS